MQPMSLWADEGGEIVFLYNDIRVAKGTIQKLGMKSLGIGVPWTGCGEIVGAASLFVAPCAAKKPLDFLTANPL
jgi:hypothetical protein